MRQSLMCFIFAAALLFECYALSAAVPMGRTEENSVEQDAFTSLLSEETAENSFSDADVASRSRGPRVIVVADQSMWKELRSLHGGQPLYKRRADDTEHRDQDLSIPILRRDTMRCMVGRVYRPCWEV
ncbi:pro-melanin-concentrating hormone, like [Sphaeramia orbicularis]|uniref:Pro-MCH-like n=1 Tax=Sphaeramia orbicularis TaxID=375764 RepID=A0A673AQ61_9TELE|nr:pro-MCH-like [Sphaeramia orbicularis]